MIDVHVVGQREIEAMLRRFEARGGNLTPVLRVIGQTAVNAVQDNFRRQAGPDGRRWKTRKYPRAGRDGRPRAGGQLLRDTGRLYRSITYMSSSKHVEVGTNVVYAAVHHFGKKFPARTIYPRRAKALRFYMKGKRVFAKSVKHPGSDVPARPYLGVGRRHADLMLAAIKRHMERAT